MLYTIGRINDDPTILPGIRLGALAFDSCDNPGYALQQAFYFVKGNPTLRQTKLTSIREVTRFVRKRFPPVGLIARGVKHSEQDYRCEDRSTPKFMNGGFDDVIAVLGAQSSSVTIQVKHRWTLKTTYTLKYATMLTSLEASLILLKFHDTCYTQTKSEKLNLYVGLQPF